MKVLKSFTSFFKFAKESFFDCFQIATLGGSFIWLTQTIFAPWTLPGERFSVHGYRNKNSDRKNRNTKRRRRRIKNRDNSWKKNYMHDYLPLNTTRLVGYFDSITLKYTYLNKCGILNKELMVLCKPSKVVFVVWGVMFVL